MGGLNLDFGPYGAIILLGTCAGMTARLLLLISDYRQYPGYPHGYLIHLSMGGIAAALGSVAVPALVTQNYTAVTFLALAAQQFRDIRNMERESLGKLEENLLIPRGLDYIEGIAKVFEARNYLVMLTAFATSLAGYVGGSLIALLTALLCILTAKKLAHGKVVADLAEVVPAKISFQGSLLMVDEIVIFNVGLADSKRKLLEQGLAVRIIPKHANARATLNSLGQRQAIVHDAALIMGAQKDVGEQEFTPLVRKNPATGELGFALLPNESNMEALLDAVRRVPVLETSIRKPLAAEAGRRAGNGV
ncbi:MAG TPA: YIEGIA family protein [Verrucomicrobiae bacterium]|nr:YIEGIA family protein [Verrucomicrobiae bacterium]